MSRIGRAPITVPAGVEVKVDEHNHISRTTTYEKHGLLKDML